MDRFGFIIGFAGYSLAALGFLFLTALLLTGFRERPRSLYLAVACAVTAIWATIIGPGSAAFSLSGFQVFVLEFTLDLGWLIFLSSLMGLGAGGSLFAMLRRIGVGIPLGIIALGVVLEIVNGMAGRSGGAQQILVFGQLITSLLVLVNVEQIIRNARKQQLRGLKYLCLAIAAIFAYDLIMYSHATLAGQINTSLWVARGYVIAMVLPLIVVAVNRAPTWSGGIFVSRQIVFHTTTVLAAGLYLTFVGIAGQYVSQYSGSWGGVAQIVFVSAAILILCLILFSERTRLHFRVFISKHFYRNKYDYRQEWLRLTKIMTSLNESLPLQKRAVKALAEIVGAPSGHLWTRSPDGSRYRVSSGWNRPESDAQLTADSSLPAFLGSSGWVIDIVDYQKDPSRYDGLDMDPAALGFGDARFIVPLISDRELVSFVVLAAPISNVALNYEDHDLLKTAGKQIASYIAQESATELLAQGRQFEAFNKLTAYLMHDLKNVIAQQSLLVENAEKHKNNPDFIEDAISTIRSGVTRMRRVIEQLRQDSVQHSLENVELGKLIVRAVSLCADRQPVPRADIGEQRVWVRADRERLQMAIVHAIRNAQDATAAEGNISIRLVENESSIEVAVCDNGEGMDDLFVRERLFRPFDSTKGTQGMGIGAYQIRETVRSAGGKLDIESTPGAGTTLKMRLPKTG